jgi:hypothetical protein
MLATLPSCAFVDKLYLSHKLIIFLLYNYLKINNIYQKPSEFQSKYYTQVRKISSYFLKIVSYQWIFASFRVDSNIYIGLWSVKARAEPAWERENVRRPRDGFTASANRASRSWASMGATFRKIPRHGEPGPASTRWEPATGRQGGLPYRNGTPRIHAAKRNR